MCDAGDFLERNSRPLCKDLDQARIRFVKGETINLGPLFPAEAFKISDNLIQGSNGSVGQLLAFENHIQFAVVTQR